MRLVCPRCGSQEARLINSGKFLRRLAGSLGYEYLQCKGCHHRYWKSLWFFREWIFARCPRCYRMKLGTWSTTHVRPTSWQQMAMSFGAKRVRCAACRVSFVSFRMVQKESGSK